MSACGRGAERVCALPLECATRGPRAWHLGIEAEQKAGYDAWLLHLPHPPFPLDVLPCERSSAS